MLTRLTALLAAAMVCPWLATAASLTWDADTSTSGAQDGSGTWNTVANNWWTGAANALFVSGTDTPIFGNASGPAGTVTLGSAITLGGNLTFNAPSVDYYTIAGGGNTLSLGAARTFTANVDATISANIGGAFLLTVQDASSPMGLLTLSGNNSFSGLTVGGATANRSCAVRLASSTGAGAAAGTITFATQGNLTSPRVELTGGITVANPIALTCRHNPTAAFESISGNNTLSGTITSGAGGSIYMINSEASSSLTLSTATLTLNTGTRNYVLGGSGNGTISGVIAGGAAGTVTLVKNGSGTWTLAGGANTFAGLATVGAGTLTLDYSTANNSKLPDAGALVLAGGTVNLNGGSHTEIIGFTAIAPGSSSITRGSGTSVLRMNTINRNRGGVVDFGAASIADCDNNDINGILPYATIAGANWAHTVASGAADTAITAYTGYTDVDALGSTIADAATSNVRLNTASGSGNITLGAATTTINTLLQNTTSAATIDTSIGTLRLGAVGGVLVPSGKQGVTFGTSANSGVLTAGGAANTTGELILINNSANDILVNAVVADNGTGKLSLTKAGSGTATLAGVNTHTGTNTIAGGTLNVSADSAFGGVPGATTAGMIVLNGGALNATASFTLNANRGVFLGISNAFNGGTISVAASQILTYNGIVASGVNSSTATTATASPGSLIKTGSGTLVLGGANTYGGSTIINGGTLQVSADGNLATAPGCYFPDNLVLNGGTLQIATGFTLNANRGILLGPAGGSGSGTIGVASGQTLTFGGRIADNWNGTGGLTKNDSGTLLLTSAFNDYSGDTTISAGTLQIGNARAIPNGAGKGNVVVNGTLNTAGTSIGINGLSGNGIVDGTSGTPIFSVGHNNASQTFSGVIKNTAGTLSLNKAGSGTQTLSGANTYSGSTTISAGTLALGSGGSIANTTTINVVGGATFDVSAAGFTLGGSQTLKGNGNIVGNLSDSSGSIIAPGASVGILTNTGNLTLAGGDTIQYEFGASTNDQIIVTGDLTPSGTTTINLAVAPPGGYVNGNYTLIQVSGNLNGSAANFTITGKPTPSRQTFDIVYDTSSTPKKVLLQVGGGVASLVWSPTNSVWDVITTYNWLNGASADVYFDSDNVSFTDAGSGTSPTINTTVSPGSVTVNSANPYLFSGNGKISGGTGLTKQNSGTLTIATTNDYTGITAISGGTLSVSNLANGGAASHIGKATSASANVVLNGGTLQFTGPTTSTDHGATLGASGGTLDVSSAASTLTLSGSIVGTSGGGLTKVGNGTLALSGGNTYDGATTINAGLAQLSGSGSFGTGPVTNSSSVLNSGNRTVANALHGAGGLTNDATGTLTLSGTGSTFSGPMTVNGPSFGGLTVSSSTALGNCPSVTVNSTTAGASGGTRVTLSGGVSTPVGTTLILNTAFDTARTMLLGAGSGTYTNTWNGPISINGNGRAQFGGGAGGVLTVNGNISSPTAASLMARNSGLIVFAGNISLSSTGMVQTADGANVAINSTGNSWATNLFANGGRWTLGANNALPTGSVFLQQATDAGVLDLNGFNQQLAAITAAANIAISNNNPSADSTLTIGGATVSSYGGVLGDNVTSKLGLTVSGGGTLVLSGANTYRGDTLISSGMIDIANATALGDVSGGTTVSSGGELRCFTTMTVAEPLTVSGVGLDGGAIRVGGVKTLTLTGGMTLGADATLLGDGGSNFSISGDLTNAGFTATFNLGGAVVNPVSGVIRGAGGLIKAGATTLRLDAANTYTGNTTINEGTLSLGASGAIPASANITVASGALFDVSAVSGFTLGPSQTLQGNGAVLGAVTANGTIAPGASIGTLSLSNSPTLNGTMLMEINTTNTPNADRLYVGSSLTYGGTLTVVNIGDAPVGGEQFDLFDATSLGGSFSATNLPALGSGLNWWLGLLVSDGKIVVNRAPTGSDKSYTRMAGASLAIAKSDLLVGAADPDSGDSVSFDTVVSTGTQGATVTDTGTGILYEPGGNGNDTLTFRLQDARGGTVVKSINITVDNSGAGGVAQTISPAGGGIAVTFAAIPTLKYDVERADDVNFTVNLVSPLVTTNAPGNGIFTILDTTPAQPTGFYRLKFNPN